MECTQISAEKIRDYLRKKSAIICGQNPRLSAGKIPYQFYKRFTHPLQLFTINDLKGSAGSIPSRYPFTKSLTVMKIIHSLSSFWYIPVISGLAWYFSFSANQPLRLTNVSDGPNSVKSQKSDHPATATVVFKSMDAGESWQEIGKELPANLPEDGSQRNKFFANEKGLFLSVENGLYHTTPNASAPFWKKEIFANRYSTIAPAKAGAVAENYWAVNLKTKNGTSVWSPIFGNFSEPRMRSVFETAEGAIFVGTAQGLFKTANRGKSWKHVYAGGWAGNMAEANGVLLTTSKRRLIRSTDNGENWVPVIGADAVTWDVKQLNGGFAAITADSASDRRRLRISSDGGKTWQPIGAGPAGKLVSNSIWHTWNDRPRVQAFQTSIILVGENFFCAHPDGIFKSADKGETWSLLLPSVKDKIFSLFVSGKVIYAVAGRGGC